MNRKLKRIIIALIICTSIILLSLLSYYLYKDYEKKEYIKEQEKIYEKATESFNSLYDNIENEIPNSNIDIDKINSVEKNVKKISSKNKEYVYHKDDMLKKIDRLREYISVKDELDSYFDEEVLKSSITDEMAKEMSNKINNLSSNFQELLEDKLNLMIEQLNNINNLKDSVTALFTDDERKKVSSKATMSKYNSALKKLDLVKQEDIVENEKKYLDIVYKELKKREEEEAARKKREQEIKNAWVILNVPYISQNELEVYNGCEAASLLMALQYKGYLKGMSLSTYAENMPKSTDPNTGFTYSIFEREPLDVPHWIAPEPLALYGRTSSGANVVNITGSNISDLNKEIMAGNPVVIYLTSRLANPKPFVEGAPLNLHVLLLVGYNTITEDNIIIDPWTQLDGSTKWTVSKSKVEKIFNDTGKRAVVVR